jgi:nitrogen fixation NifU-like protein
MTSDWDSLQEMVIAGMRKVYSETVIDYAMNPRNLGRLDDADGFARVTGSCGDTMEMWLKIRDNTITGATFLTDGCATTVVAGGMITELARGKSVAQALRINQLDVLNALGGLPEESHHCALLATNTMKEAVRDYLALKKEPWKKAYKKY